MGHSMVDLNGKKLGLIALALVGMVLAVYVFKVSWNVFGTVGLIGLMLLMHGGHGGHGGHGSQDEEAPRDEDAGHSVPAAGNDGARAIAADTNARGLPTDGNVQTAKGEETHRHSGC